MNIKRLIAVSLTALISLQTAPVNILADEVSSQALTVSSVSASDKIMSLEYWKNHRVGTEVSEDTYISEFSNNSGQYGSSYLKYAFDGNWSTHWETNGGNNSTIKYVDVTFNKTTKIDRILYATRQDSAKGKGYPTTATIYSYNSDTDTWEQVATGQSSVSNSYVLMSLPQATNFDKLRFEFTVAYNGWASASEFVFLRPEDTVLNGDINISGTSAIGKTITANPNLSVGNADNLYYQWQYSDDGNEYVDIENANSKNYTITEQKNYYRVKVSDSTKEYAGTLYSSSYAGSIEAKVIGSTKVGCVATADIKYVDENESLYYKWQYSDDNTTFIDIPSATSIKYSIEPTMANKYIRIGISGNNNDYIYSNSVFIPVSAIMTGPCQVGSQIIANLKGVENGEYTYQWQESDTQEGEYTNIDSAINSVYTPTKNDVGKYLRAIVTLSSTGESFVSTARIVSDSGTYPERTGDFVYISDLPTSALIESSVGYSSLKYDTNVENGAISLKIDGKQKTFLKGLGAHAAATLVYDVSYLVNDYNYEKFTGYLGVDYSKGSNGNGVIFKIYTSTDNSTWTEVKNTGVLKGDSEAVYVDIDLKNINYLKFYIDPNGNNAYDHSIIANGKFATADYEEPSATSFDFIKTSEQYKTELLSYSDQNSEEYRKTLYQKYFVDRVGYETLVDIAAMSDNNKNAIQWFLNDFETLEYFANGGQNKFISNSKTAIILSNIYKTYSQDLSNSLYKRLLVALMYSHSGNVYFWADGNKVSDPVKRFGIYKRLYENGHLMTGIFETLNVPEMIFVVNSISDDDEIEWLNYYVRKCSAEKANVNFDELTDSQLQINPYSYIKYTGGYNYYLDKYYTEDNKQSWIDKYHLVNTDDDIYDDTYNINIPFENGQPKLWVVFEEGAVCGGISKTGSNILASFGMPSRVVGQPGHAAYLRYELNDVSKGEDALGVWSIWNNIYGWQQSSRSDIFYMPLDWGEDSWNGGYHVSYTLLAQGALNDYDNFKKAEDLIKIADLYDSETALSYYEQAIDVQGCNLDAWVKLISAYKANNKTDDDYVELANRVANELKYYPMPMKEVIINLIEPNISDTAKQADLTILCNNTLKEATKATESDSLQYNDCKTMANYLLNGTDISVASFLFSGDKANTIVLSDNFVEGSNEFLFSLDGGENWTNAGTVSSYTLNEEELAQISADNDILVKLQGSSSYYTIDIKSATTPTNLYINDNENIIFNMQTSYEWSEDNGKTWTTYVNGTKFEGTKTILVRVPANNTTMASDIVTLEFTQNNQNERCYVSNSRIKVIDYSSKQNDSEKPENTIDGNKNTMWHTTHTTNSDLNRYISYEFDKPILLSGIDYTPRQNSGTNGMFTKCGVYVSKDGTNWTQVTTATWEVNTSTKSITLDTPVYTKYVRVKGEETMGNWGSASMIEFFENVNTDNYDINKDSSIDKIDSALLLRYVNGMSVSSDISFENADFNYDGNIDMLDVIMLNSYIASCKTTSETTTETTTVS